MGHSGSPKQGFAVLEGLLILVIIAILGFVGWFVIHAKHSTERTLTSSNSASLPATSKSATITPGTDDKSLQQDLTNIDSSQSQEEQDSASAASGLNDSSQQISVPTN